MELIEDGLVLPGPPESVLGLLGRRGPGSPPNNSDAGGKSSIAIAEAFLDALGIGPEVIGHKDPGKALEHAVAEWLDHWLTLLAPGREWQVNENGRIDRYIQYEHLRQLDEVVRNNPALRADIGADYLVAPDVTIGFPPAGRAGSFLHACVSCKWTLRSDRAQNVRHEAVILTRHRRGRQPHIVAVTAEPMPTRLASLARGTGEVDALYHVALPQLESAVRAVGSTAQVDTLDEMAGQRRLLDITELPMTLTL